MPSVVDICNKALDKLGQNPITSLQDGNKSANLCLRNWELIRDEVLRAHPWNFAVKRDSLAADAGSTPSWGFTKSFPLPSDCLRLIELKDSNRFDYELEGRDILCDESVLYIRYIRKITDPNQYDSMFVEVVAARLAVELCEPLTQSNTKRKVADKALEKAWTTARSVDAQENPAGEEVEDYWVSVRN